MHVIAWFVSCYAKTCAHPDWSQLNWPDGMVWTAVQAARNHSDGGGGSSGRGGGSRDDVDDGDEGDANVTSTVPERWWLELPLCRRPLQSAADLPQYPYEALSLTVRVLPQSVWLRSAFLGHGRHGDVFAIPWPLVLSAVGPKPIATCSVAVKAFESSLRGTACVSARGVNLQGIASSPGEARSTFAVRRCARYPWPAATRAALGPAVGPSFARRFCTLVHHTTAAARRGFGSSAGFEQSDTEPRNFVLLWGDDGT